MGMGNMIFQKTLKRGAMLCGFLAAICASNAAQAVPVLLPGWSGVSIDVTIDPYEPTIFAVSLEAQPDLRVTAPASASRGANVTIAIDGEHIVHLDVEDPQGKTIPHYSGNFIALKFLPLAYNDPAGAWKIKVRDTLTGQTKTIPLQVN